MRYRLLKDLWRSAIPHIVVVVGHIVGHIKEEGFQLSCKQKPRPHDQGRGF
jgi:hypothetical protein